MSANLFTDSAGDVVRSSQPLTRPLPRSDEDEVSLPDADHRYVLATEDAGEYDVTVAVSLEEVDDSTSALLPPLLIGLPLLLLLVGGTTWMVATRALAPVERIRAEVDQISGDQLERRVPEPSSRERCQPACGIGIASTMTCASTTATSKVSLRNPGIPCTQPLARS